MSRRLFSPSWHSVAQLRPKLIPQARMYRHVYRGEVWFVIQNRSGGQHHRISPGAYRLLLAMDGSKTTQELWEAGNTDGVGDHCTQNEFVELLVQLHTADLLHVNVRPDAKALYERHRERMWAKLKQLLLNPLSLKLPLLDPNRMLERMLPVGRLLFSQVGLLVWALTVLPALVLAAQHWTELTHDMSGQLLSASNLLAILLVYPAVKALHEIGHGLAAKVWGAQVHEAGLMFLVFAPVPYVDLSATTAFPSKHQRAIVAGAGILVELWLAALSLYVWILIEPGLARSVAYNVMMVSGISTLWINGNPLLRYDGYYVLCDLIEIPNLGQRGEKYVAYLWDKYIYRARELKHSTPADGERTWFVIYTPIAWCYRLGVSFGIALFVAQKFFIFGVLIALWSAFTQLCKPAWKSWKHVSRSPILEQCRSFAYRVYWGSIAALLLLLFVIPLPLSTRADGVVWLPEKSLVRASENGFFQEWLVQPGHQVRAGTPLFLMSDAELEAELKQVQARCDEAEARFRSEQFSDPAKARLSLRQLEQEQATLARVKERHDRLLVHAEADGILVVAKAADLPGQFIKQGALVAHVLDKQELIARVVITQDDIDLVRQRLDHLELRYADQIESTYPSHIVRQATGAVTELPSPALGLGGGGEIPTQPNDKEGLQTLQRVFLMDLALPGSVAPAAFGERVYVRFSLDWEPMGWQILRRLRQLFLREFSV